ALDVPLTDGAEPADRRLPGPPFAELSQELLGRDKERILLKNAVDDDYGMCPKERVGGAASDFVLWEAGAQRRRELVPEGIESAIGYFEEAADVGWLALVEEKIGAGCVVVSALTTLEKFQRYQGIEEIAG